VQSKGVTIKQMYWTLGHYDQVCLFEAPIDETAASVLLSADILGNIRTQTLRAFFERRDGEDSRQHSLTAASQNVLARKQGRLLLSSYDRGASRPAVVVC
jgi:GYD domain